MSFTFGCGPKPSRQDVPHLSPLLMLVASLAVFVVVPRPCLVGEFRDGIHGHLRDVTAVGKHSAGLIRNLTRFSGVSFASGMAQ